MLSSIAFRFSRSPRDAVAVLVAVTGVTAIFCNALFMQRGPHPAPIFSYRSSPAPAKAAPPQPVSHHADAGMSQPQASPAQHASSSAAAAEKPSGDPIGDLVNKTNRVAAVQRALSRYGFGQIRANGVMTRETKMALDRFQRDRGLRVTGQISDETVAALDAMTGQTIPK